LIQAGDLYAHLWASLGVIAGVGINEPEQNEAKEDLK